MSDSARTEMFFPTVIRISRIPNHERLNAQIMRSVEKLKETEPNSLPAGWSCTLYTTIGSPTPLFRRPGFESLVEQIKKEANKFASLLELDVENHPLKLIECWMNIYDDTNSQDVHIHRNCVISGIYYPQAPKGSGELLIHSPYAEMMLDPPKKKTNQLNGIIKQIEPEEGMMVLFRSFVRHSVKPNRSEKPRVSIAFNLTM